jgi:hypothetical protein
MFLYGWFSSSAVGYWSVLRIPWVETLDCFNFWGLLLRMLLVVGSVTYTLNILGADIIDSIYVNSMVWAYIMLVLSSVIQSNSFV